MLDALGVAATAEEAAPSAPPTAPVAGVDCSAARACAWACPDDGVPGSIAAAPAAAFNCAWLAATAASIELAALEGRTVPPALSFSPPPTVGNGNCNPNPTGLGPFRGGTESTESNSLACAAVWKGAWLLLTTCWFKGKLPPEPPCCKRLAAAVAAAAVSAACASIRERLLGRSAIADSWAPVITAFTPAATTPAMIGAWLATGALDEAEGVDTRASTWAPASATSWGDDTGGVPMTILAAAAELGRKFAEFVFVSTGFGPFAGAAEICPPARCPPLAGSFVADGDFDILSRRLPPGGWVLVCWV